MNVTASLLSNALQCTVACTLIVCLSHSACYMLYLWAWAVQHWFHSHHQANGLWVRQLWSIISLSVEADQSEQISQTSFGSWGIWSKAPALWKHSLLTCLLGNGSRASKWQLHSVLLAPVMMWRCAHCCLSGFCLLRCCVCCPEWLMINSSSYFPENNGPRQATIVPSACADLTAWTLHGPCQGSRLW